MILFWICLIAIVSALVIIGIVSNKKRINSIRSNIMYRKRSHQIFIFEGKKYYFKGTGKDKVSGFHIKGITLDELEYLNIPYGERFKIEWTKKFVDRDHVKRKIDAIKKK